MVFANFEGVSKSVSEVYHECVKSVSGDTVFERVSLLGRRWGGPVYGVFLCKIDLLGGCRKPVLIDFISFILFFFLFQGGTTLLSFAMVPPRSPLPLPDQGTPLEPENSIKMALCMACYRIIPFWLALKARGPT